MYKSDSSIMYIGRDDESLQRDLFEIYDYLGVDYSDRVFHVLNKNVIDHLKVLLPELEHFKNLGLVITNENIIPLSSCVSFIDDVNIGKLIGAQKKGDTLSNYKDIIRILNDNYEYSFENEAESSDSFLTAFKADYNDLLKFSAILCDVDSIADLDDVGIGFKNSGIDLSFSDGKVKNLLLYAKSTGFTKKDLEHRLKGWSSVISEISQINIDFKRQLYNLFGCIGFKNLIDFRGINGCMSNNLYNVLDFEKDGNRVGFAKLIADLYHSVDRGEDSYVYKLGTGEELICRYSEDDKLIIGKLYEVAGNIFRFRGSIESNSAFDSRNLRHGIIDYDDFYVNNCGIDDFDIKDHNVYSNDVDVLLCHGESCDLIHNCNCDINFLSKYLKLDLSDSDIQNIQLYSKLSCFCENTFIDIFRHWFSRFDRICCMHPKFLKQLYNLFGHIDSENLVKFSDVNGCLSDEVYDILMSSFKLLDYDSYDMLIADWYHAIDRGEKILKYMRNGENNYVEFTDFDREFIEKLHFNKLHKISGDFSEFVDVLSIFDSLDNNIFIIFRRLGIDRGGINDILQKFKNSGVQDLLSFFNENFWRYLIRYRHMGLNINQNNIVPLSIIMIKNNESIKSLNDEEVAKLIGFQNLGIKFDSVDKIKELLSYPGLVREYYFKKICDGNVDEMDLKKKLFFRLTNIDNSNDCELLSFLENVNPIFLVQLLSLFGNIKSDKLRGLSKVSNECLLTDKFYNDLLGNNFGSIYFKKSVNNVNNLFSSVNLYIDNLRNEYAEIKRLNGLTDSELLSEFVCKNPYYSYDLSKIRKGLETNLYDLSRIRKKLNADLNDPIYREIGGYEALCFILSNLL